MSLNRYTLPQGLDRQIDNLQVKLYNYLNWSNHDSYPRVYMNGEKLEYCINSKDYKDVLFNDKVAASSFFVLKKNEPVIGTFHKATMAVIFQVNLKTLKPSVTAKIPDEDLINEVLITLNYLPSFDLKEVKKGVNDVYSDLGITLDKRNEMSNWSVFRFDFETTYYIDQLSPDVLVPIVFK